MMIRRGARNAGRRWQLRRPLVEGLESRMLLAGNVTTFPTGTPNSPGEATPVLEIDGDPFDNEVMVRKGTAPGEIIVNGLNGTLVNGSTQEWHFQGVQSLTALMDGGNDKVDVRNLTLSGTSDEFGSALAEVVVDGGQGDDRITLFNTTIDSTAPVPNPDLLFFPSSTVTVLLLGESSAVGPTDGTGNDFIEVSNTTIIAGGGQGAGVSLGIYGEQNAGGTITGGNDRINVSNTVIRATNASFLGAAQAAVQIFGDDNTAGDVNPPTSIIGQGNDWIDVNNTQIIADSAQGSGSAMVQVYGDRNVTIGTGTATIGNFAAKTGGNDTINLTNTTVSAGGAFSNNSAVVDVRGDQNFSALGVADVGGGNDTISITNFAAGASGLASTNETDLRVFGDGDVSAAASVTSRVGVGNDTISLANDDVFASGNPNNTARVLFFSDDRTQAGEVGTAVGQGDDNVQFANVLLNASTVSSIQLETQKGKDLVDIRNLRANFLGMNTGSGNDDVSVLNSRLTTGNWDFGAGNDLLKLNGCTFLTIDANGGAGIDTLQARGNTGVLVPVSFEIIT